MRLHLLALPHTQTTSDYTSCAYTMKVLKACKMFMEEGHSVFLYSGEHNEAPCTEHIQVVDERWRHEHYGHFDVVQTRLTWAPNSPEWLTFNSHTIEALSHRLEPHDLILVTAGLAQEPIAHAFPNHLVIEWGIGYEGVFAPYRVYESYAWMHYLYGKLGVADGRWFDTVIPNFFDPLDFDYQEQKEEYLLYCGRVVSRKGVQAAAELAEHAGLPLVVAGPGVIETTPWGLQTTEGQVVGTKIEYVGTVGKAERSTLMRGARALLAPTCYIEPFGGVVVEAAFCGTPAITSDFGAFAETVEHGRTGFRFSTLAEGLDAIEKSASLDPAVIRHHAEQHYSLSVIGPQYSDYFKRVSTVWGNGYYELEPQRSGA